MKKVLTLLAILALGVSSALAASDSIDKGGYGATSDLGRAIFYSQPATTGPYYLYAGNASLAFAAEVADDIPTSLVGQAFNEVGCYIIEWGGPPWVTPNGLKISIYGGDCPPDQTGTSYYFTWAQMTTVNQNDPSYWIYYAEAQLPAPVTIVSGMSIGFQVDHGTSQAAPYAGILMADIAYGCGSAYRDGANWGYPRWTSFASLGYNYDLAYSLGLEYTAIGTSTWSSVKALY